MSLKIVQLEAENFKRLTAIEVTPSGHVVTIAGNNGEGKSSLLDSIWVTLVGRSVAPPEPIKQGEEQCRLALDLGELRIVRTFTRKDDGDYTDTLRVEDPDGLKYPKPQAVLDALLGELGFDPFAFVNMKPSDQAKKLRTIVPLEVDLDELAAKDKRIYDTRRDVNRDAKQREAQLTGMPGGELREVPDLTELRTQLATAAETNSTLERRRAARERFAEDLAHDTGALAARRQTIQELIQSADEIETQLAARTKQIEEAEELPDPVDITAIADQLEKAAADEDHNRTVNQRAVVAAELKQLIAKSQDYTAQLEANEQIRSKALAKAKFPVEGLAFTDSEDGARVTFNGVPFEQASMAEKLRVSTGIAMAANPKLRVLRIMDGALLDENSMHLLTEMATEHDFQLWIELVKPNESTGIILENGAIVGQTIESKIVKKEPKPAATPQPDADGEVMDPATGELTPAAPDPEPAPAERISRAEYDALSPARRAFIYKQGLAPIQE